MSQENQAVSLKPFQEYKFALKPTATQDRTMMEFAGACRLAYNLAMAWHRQHNAADKPIEFSYSTLERVLPAWREDRELSWLKMAPSQSIQQALRDADRQHWRFIHDGMNAEFPLFRRKGEYDRFRYMQGVKVDQLNHLIFLPKIGWLRYRYRTEALGSLGEVKKATISLKGASGWVASALIAD